MLGNHMNLLALFPDLKKKNQFIVVPPSPPPQHTLTAGMCLYLTEESESLRRAGYQ